MYAYGTGEVYKSTNGGTDWVQTSQLDSLYYEQIQFLDNRVGYICGTPGKVYKSEDGGDSWVEKSIPIDSSLSYLLYSMYFYNADTGFVTGMLRGPNRSSQITTHITTTGGENWERVDSLVDVMLFDIEHHNGELYAIANQFFLKKNDWKASWEVIAKDSLFGQVRDFDIDGNIIIGMDFFKGYLFRSNDFGQTWIQDSISNNLLRSVEKIGPQEWIIVGSKRRSAYNIYRSLDNGNTWEQDSTNTSGIHRLVKNDDYVWMVGMEGYVAKRRIAE